MVRGAVIGATRSVLPIALTTARVVAGSIPTTSPANPAAPRSRDHRRVAGRIARGRGDHGAGQSRTVGSGESDRSSSFIADMPSMREW